MESEKQESSETSSEENDQQEQVKDSTKRSYECTYCKRGFTNAQALGGHMNIHRKDRAKSKAKAHLTITSSSHSNKSDEDHNYISSSRFVGPIISNESTKYSCPDLGFQRNYPIFFQPTVSDSGYPHANFYENVLLGPTSQSLSMNYQELLRPNLSLRTGPTHREDNEVGRDVRKEEDEVDLELRLGHHHDR